MKSLPSLLAGTERTEHVVAHHVVARFGPHTAHHVEYDDVADASLDDRETHAGGTLLAYLDSERACKSYALGRLDQKSPLFDQRVR